jgi:phytanoyl-CoA hydroxylase
MTLSQNDVDFFAENGFLVVKNVFSKAEAEYLSECYTQGIEGLRRAGELQDIHDPDSSDDAELYQLRMAHMRHPCFSMLINDSRLLDVAEVLLGPNLSVLNSSGIYKPAKTGGEVPWHPDNFYLKVEKNRTIALWIAFDDATIESGCLWYMPTREGELLPHEQVWDPREKRGFYYRIPTGRLGDGVPAEVSKGDIAIHHGLTPHRSGANRSAAPRRSMTVHLIDTSVAHAGHLLAGPAGSTREVRRFDLRVN